MTGERATREENWGEVPFFRLSPSFLSAFYPQLVLCSSLQMHVIALKTRAYFEKER